MVWHRPGSFYFLAATVMGVFPIMREKGTKNKGGSPFDPVNHNYPSDGSLWIEENFNVKGPNDSPYDAALAFVDASGQTAHGGHCPRHCSAPSYEIYDGTNPEDCTQWTYATGVSGTSANKSSIQH